MVVSYLRGVCNESELDRIISKLVNLDSTPVSKLASSRWILSEGVVTRLLKTARKALKTKPTLLRDIPAPCVMVGDLHGDIHTLIRILKHNGMPPKARYLFLGDYVDRGCNSVEVLALILALHCRYPQNVHCLRGNHETVMMSRAYGFLTECRHRYSTRIYAASTAVFNMLPIAAIVGGRVFAVHGGLTPRLERLADIDAIVRPAKLEADTLLADLIWGDPVVGSEVQDYAESDRGAGHLFGQRAFDTFMKQHDFVAMVRAHEVCRRGCRRSFGTCWTVFSHPQYLGLTNAAGALVLHDDMHFEPQLFAANEEDLAALADHPLDAEDEEAIEAVPRCMESVMLEEEDNASMSDFQSPVRDELGLQVGSSSTNCSEPSAAQADASNISAAPLHGCTPSAALTEESCTVAAASSADAKAIATADTVAASPPPGAMSPLPSSSVGLIPFGTPEPDSIFPPETSVVAAATSASRVAAPTAAATPLAINCAVTSPREPEVDKNGARSAAMACEKASSTTPVLAAASPAAPVAHACVPAPGADACAPASDAIPSGHSVEPASLAYALAAQAGLPAAQAEPLAANAKPALARVLPPPAVVTTRAVTCDPAAAATVRRTRGSITGTHAGAYEAGYSRVELR